MSSVEPDEGRDELDGREKGAGEFIIACGYSPKPFELAEKPLNQVAFAVKSEVGFALDEPIGLGGNHRDNPPFFQSLDQGIGVVGLVGEEGFGFDFCEQGGGLPQVRVLAGGERYGNGIAKSIGDNVDLGAQSASGSTDGLTGAVFFRAPALC